MAEPKVCRHCRGVRPIRRRGLCWPCHGDLAVREQYGPVSACGQTGAGLREPTSPAAFPTHALPGSAQKVDVMRLRASLREQLHHPADATQDDGDWSIADIGNPPRSKRAYRLAVPA